MYHIRLHTGMWKFCSKTLLACSPLPLLQVRNLTPVTCVVRALPLPATTTIISEATAGKSHTGEEYRLLNSCWFSDSKKRLHRCDFCGKMYTASGSLRLHLKSHLSRLAANAFNTINSFPQGPLPPRSDHILILYSFHITSASGIHFNRTV